MPTNFSADHFIKQFVAVGHELTIEGLSVGFAEAARIFFLSGSTQYEHFIQIIHYIADAKLEELAMKAKNFKLLLKNKQRVLTKEETMIRGMLGIFYIVSAFSQPKIHQKQFGALLSQTNVMEITQFIESILFQKYKNQLGGTAKIGSFPIIFNGKDEISFHYVNMLKDIAKCATTKPYARISFCLDNTRRRVHLGYDGEQKKWSINDIENMETQRKYFDAMELTDVIASTMSGITSDYSVAFDTSIYTTKLHHDKFKKNLKECIRPHKVVFNIKSAILCEDQKNNQKIKKAHDGMSYVHLAAIFGYDGLIKQIQQHDRNALSNALKIAIDKDDVLMTKKILPFFSCVTKEIVDKVIEVYKKNKTQPAILPDMVKSISVVQSLRLMNLTIMLGDFAGFKTILEQRCYKTEILSSILKNILSEYHNIKKTNEKLKMVHYLLVLGVNANQSYCNGVSILQRAILLRQPELVAILAEHAKEEYKNAPMLKV